MNLSDSISTIKNIGEDRTKKLNKLGIFSINDLIEYFPRDYDDRSNVKKISEIELNKVNTIKGKIVLKPETLKIKNITITKTRIQDETAFLEVIWFNQQYLKNTLKLKQMYIFTGKIVNKFGRIQLESPDYELIDDKELLSNGRIVPIYSSTYKFSQKLFREIINKVLKDIKPQITEFIPISIIKKFNLCERIFAIENIHFPKNDDAFFKARKRLVFEELFLLQMKLISLKGNIESEKSNINIVNFSIQTFIKLLKFELTNDQKQVVFEICEDFKLNKIMNRLVQGDVGSGKTIVAFIAAFILINNGYQVALMVPTDVLARQHFDEAVKIFSKFDIKVDTLVGSQKSKEKKEVYEKLETGEINFIIGTHAIIQDNVKFKNLGLVITDEQHRFGVRQRIFLAQKGNKPHILVMTATPIPRTLAFILYGDLDISIIKNLPPGRQKIDTIFVNSSYYKRIYNFIKKNSFDKKQTYIICPMIEETDKQEFKSVITYAEKLKKDVFNEYRVEYLHGKLKNSLKQEIMTDFYNGKIDILVSTTVIEVGVNVPNATIIVIENAERFGLSQLHQLRGRIGRGNEKSYCILISDTKNNNSQKRLNSMVNFSDGFSLSEKDLELRGPGDFFGTRQHGIPEMKIANLYKDLEILKLVQKASKELYLKDPKLEQDENLLLKERINDFFHDEECKAYL